MYTVILNTAIAVYALNRCYVYVGKDVCTGLLLLMVMMMTMMMTMTTTISYTVRQKN